MISLVLVLTTSAEMPRYVWQCWFQGLADVESRLHFDFVGLDAWRKLHQDTWNYTLLTNENIPQYVPEFVPLAKHAGRTLQAKSDMLRLVVLNKYGGVWVDASVYPTRRLESWVYTYLEPTGFFTFRFHPRNDHRETVSWFLAVDQPRHYLISHWLDKYMTSYLKPGAFAIYYTVHRDLCTLYDTDARVRHIIDDMPQVSEQLPHSYIRGDPQRTFNLSSPHVPMLKRPKKLDAGWYKDTFFHYYNLSSPQGRRLTSWRGSFNHGRRHVFS